MNSTLDRNPYGEPDGDSYGRPLDPSPSGPDRLGFLGTLGRWTTRLILGVVLMGLLVVGGTAIRVWQVARIDDNSPAEAIVVLGAAQYSGTPSTVFEARLDQAAALYEQGVAPEIVTVGGKQEGDLFTEAASGRNYLIEQGVPADKITAVEEGSDTLESIEAVSDTLREQGRSSVVLVSDPWHSLRTRTMARDAGLDAWTSPTRTGPAVYTRESQAHGIARETGALLWYQLTHFTADFSYTAGQ
ncbi:MULTISPECIES: YdcF family protein [unclassified Rhodococcus (in: high G+C Gram-positive bacteria)]|uniref:YdcF family protein n=1 Tax=unclassified Rhodococcus (in: high G+C Gram-positive bacteria) TaxID=192944 RepID=UPI0033936900